MSTIVDEFGELIEIPSQDIQFDQYLHILNIQKNDKLSFIDKKKIFLCSVSDFQSGELSTDDISEMASHLFYTPSDPDEKLQQEVESILLTTSELSWEIRRMFDREPFGQSFVGSTYRVLGYFDEHKALIQEYLQRKKKLSDKQNKAKEFTQISDQMIKTFPFKKIRDDLFVLVTDGDPLPWDLFEPFPPDHYTDYGYIDLQTKEGQTKVVLHDGKTKIYKYWDYLNKEDRDRLDQAIGSEFIQELTESSKS